ncbi:ICE2-domain-containing protein [Lepidopterella palustris CBS 459.81]|uniref:ICE2-domain-containing protein n=1 Tax=Lepidopterella palustris CBS 459.81 TaxID=1314670 RepID=A0A8E2EGK8_9PEZI|nr:ICE2-domain-containing protein [Lepidopterella palustris CBS 459.81]
MWITRVFSSTLFLAAIVFTIPLAFDIGGRTCGLAFSLSLASYYFFYSALRLATPDGSRFRYSLVTFIAWTQWLMIPTLLIWSLNKFSVDSDNSSGWVERTFGGKSAQDTSLQELIFGRGGLAEAATVGVWDKLLRWSTPVFQLGEGFCSLLVIQAAGQITRWLVNRERGDTWMIGLLLFSASVIANSVYFLWRITKFPEISNGDAMLIGGAIACSVFLCSWGIGSGRGNPVESSLLFAYVTLCIYQIFTDYQPSGAVEVAPVPSPPALPPLPPILMASYTTLIHALSTLPTMIHSGFNLMVGAIMTVTPSVIISLAYRVFVMYASARIIPAIRDSGVRALSQAPSLEDNDEAGQFLGFLSWFSPSILIAVYTSLLMQHFASTNGDTPPGDWWRTQDGAAGGNFWRWINLAVTMVIYAIELKISKEDDDTRLMGHWKTD